jgi:hypothetical protein
MNAGHFPRVARFGLLALSCLVASTPVRATPILQDKGIYLAGPFPVPDITQPPGASAEAVFLAGSVAHAPLYFNELVIAGNGGQFSNNGWVGSSPFNVSVVNGGRAVWISWDFSGTPYALTYVSVNFNNNFYHVYETSPRVASQGAVEVTGNLRDAMSHIHFFGIGRVPDAGATGSMFALALCVLGFFRRRFGRCS